MKTALDIALAFGGLTLAGLVAIAVVDFVRYLRAGSPMHNHTPPGANRFGGSAAPSNVKAQDDDGRWEYEPK